MHFQTKSGQSLGDRSWQCSINTADSAEWPAQKSKRLPWGWMRGHTGNVPSPRQTGRSFCRCRLCFFPRGCRSMPGLPSWKYDWGKQPSFSLFSPSLALHFSLTSLSLVHSEAGVPEEAWRQFPNSATEPALVWMGWVFSLAPDLNSAQCRKSWQNWPFFPLCDSNGTGFSLPLSNILILKCKWSQKLIKRFTSSFKLLLSHLFLLYLTQWFSKHTFIFFFKKGKKALIHSEQTNRHFPPLFTCWTYLLVVEIGMLHTHVFFLLALISHVRCLCACSGLSP